jgi:hypothetical protein
MSALGSKADIRDPARRSAKDPDIGRAYPGAPQLHFAIHEDASCNALARRWRAFELKRAAVALERETR